MFDPARRRSVAPVFPAGVGQTELQVQAIADLKPDGYAGTPSFLQDHPREGRRDEARLPSLRKALGERRGVLCRACATCSPSAASRAIQLYGTADLGWSPTRPKRAKDWSWTKA